VKSKLAPLTLVVALLAFAGCASAGTKVEQSTASSIQKGVTTKEDLVALLGPPKRDITCSTGRELLGWYYSKTHAKAIFYVPYVDVVASVVSPASMYATTRTNLEVVFNKKGVVEDYRWWNDSMLKPRLDAPEFNTSSNLVD